jgi:hypothetical protein
MAVRAALRAEVQASLSRSPSFGSFRAQARRPIAVNDGHQAAAVCLYDPPAHRCSDDEVLLINLTLDFMHVDLGQLAVGRIRIHAEEILWLANRNLMKPHVHEAVAERRIEPQLGDIERIGRWRY